MRSIDLLCPCSTPNTIDDLKATTDATLIEGINATLKEVADSITASNTDIKDALNNLGKDTKIDVPTPDEPTINE